MLYSELVNVYEQLASTTKRLEKTTILAKFLKNLKDSKTIYLLAGRVVPDYDSRELGISQQLAIKTIAHSFSIDEKKVSDRFNKTGDLGEIAREFSEKKRQSSLFSSKLTIQKVFDSITKLMEIEGKGAIDKKLLIISDLLSNASPLEAKYIVRTLLSDLKIGVSAPTIVDSLAESFEIENEKIQAAFDLANDFAIIFNACSKGQKELEKISLLPGRPINVMLATKVTTIEEAFEICGKPAAIEEKYDGFRMLISKDKQGNISLFTRRLEDVTKQFPDVVKVVKENIQGNSFILDSEIVGYDPKTKKYRPFEAISQRIRRKYEIEETIKTLPVEVNVFDVVYYEEKDMINTPFIERRKLVEKIIKEKSLIIRPAVQIVTDSPEVAMDFFYNALKIGEEGIMIKAINAPYKQGRRVGYMCKMKPEINDLDLVIVGAEYGTGKRGGWLTSYIVACRDKDQLLEVGKVSSGLKEKDEEGFSYEQMTSLLKPLIEEKTSNAVKVKPEIVVSVTYQNIQASPSYSSGFALRFPRISHYRPDRSIKDIVSLDEIKKEAKRGRK
jgi:DNA ligase-1